ncbi:MAG: hypothetical protein HKN42_12055 [Granulosicoccus sp.]|nr:hypothetical protein [Granulosicoccus sp.]
MNKLKSILGNTLLLVVVSAIAFSVAEFATRVLYKDTTEMFPRYHTDAQYGDFTLRRIIPNSEFVHTSIDGSWKFTTNSQGFRNYQDFTYDKPDNTVRVVSLGDSHTQGVEADQDYTYSSIIEKYLTTRGIGAQVFNTGVSGFSNAEALVLLEQELVKYAPDFVVLGFFANDYQDNVNANIYRLNDSQELEVASTVRIPGVNIQNVIYQVPGVKWLSENSYFYSLLFNNVWAYFKSRQADGEPNEVAVATTQEFSDYEIDLTAALIERIYDVTHEMGAKLIILDIPQVEALNRSRSSVVEGLLSTVQENSDHFVSNDVLSRYQGSARLHVPHGQFHISEFTHTILGVEAASHIQEEIENPVSSSGGLQSSQAQ